MKEDKEEKKPIIKDIDVDDPKIKEKIRTFKNPGRCNKELMQYLIYLLQGYNQPEAYLKAFGNPNNLSRKEIAARASQKKASPTAQRFIEHIRSTVIELERLNTVFEGVMTVEDRRIFLSQIISGKIKNQIVSKTGDIIETEASIETKLKSVDLLNKMDLLYNENNKDTTADVVINVTNNTTNMENILNDPNKDEDLIEPVPNLPEVKEYEIKDSDNND